MAIHHCDSKVSSRERFSRACREREKMQRKALHSLQYILFNYNFEILKDTLMKL